MRNKFKRIALGTSSRLSAGPEINKNNPHRRTPAVADKGAEKMEKSEERASQKKNKNKSYMLNHSEEERERERERGEGKEEGREREAKNQRTQPFYN